MVTTNGLLKSRLLQWLCLLWYQLSTITTSVTTTTTATWTVSTTTTWENDLPCQKRSNFCRFWKRTLGCGEINDLRKLFLLYILKNDSFSPFLRWSRPLQDLVSNQIYWGSAESGIWFAFRRGGGLRGFLWSHWTQNFQGSSPTLTVPSRGV